MTIREALAEGTASLAASGIETPGLDSSLLLAEVLNTNRSLLTAAGLDPVSQTSVIAFRQLIKRRQSGECAAYILGRKEFYGMEFLVNPSVLVPRPDTETLVETALRQIREQGIGSREQGAGNREQGTGNREQRTLKKADAGKQPFRVLDLCTGCGAIAIALKHTIPELEVWAADISAEALETAKTNAARLLPSEIIHFYCGDLFDAFSILGLGNREQGTGSIVSNYSELTNMQCSRTITPVPEAAMPPPQSLVPLIVSNPPYIPTNEISSLSPEVRMEPALALDGGDDGLNVIRKIVSRAPEFLCSGGSLLLEADPRQMGDIASLYEEAGFYDIQAYTDLSGRERVIGGII